MSQPTLTIGPRVRKSPFYDATLRWGAKSFSVYNHMYMPTSYAGSVAEYWSLVRDVTVWDVACERQLEVAGRDARRFAQYLTCRNLSALEVGQVKYAPLVDENGGIVNDPVVLRIAANQYWFSLADSDALLWAKGIAAGGGWRVRLSEPDVSPLQIQGPRSLALMREVFGPQIEGLRYFRFIETELDGAPLVISRTGWSGERGYEAFLRDANFGDLLWERLMEAGAAFGVAPACPSAIRRTEAAILSYGGDMDLSTNPFEVGLGRLVSFAPGVEYLGRAALERAAAHPPTRRLAGLRIHGGEIAANEHRWPVRDDGRWVGAVTSAVRSPRLNANIALANLAGDVAGEGRILSVECDGDKREATVVAIPFIDPKRELPRAGDRPRGGMPSLPHPR